MAKAKTIKVVIKCDYASGKYLLPYVNGAVVDLEEKLAKEMIKNEDAILESQEKSNQKITSEKEEE